MGTEDDGASTIVRLSLSSTADRAAMEELLTSGRVRACHDALLDQLRELVAVERPDVRLDPAAIAAAVTERLGDADPAAYGVWVFYPWSGRLVHVLPEPEFRRLRADRNRYKITPDEERRLRGACIGIVGLSVGQAAALTCALEGVGGRFRLADFDRLGLSNLNRLQGGVHDIGVPKVALAARRMLELDPYLDIATFPHGVTEDNVDAFLTEGGKLDLLVEECDGLYLKLLLRARARAFGIPVIMDTSDRGMLDVERFDREPARPLLHGLVGDLRPEQLVGLTTKEKIPIVLGILGARTISTRLAASMVEIDETIATWPQLASGVMLGGALVADAGRRILLDQLTTSGRFHVDLESLVSDGTAKLAEPAAPAAPELFADPHPLPPLPRTGSVPTAEELGAVVAYGALAPSAGNNQAWRFQVTRGRVDVRRDSSRVTPFLDPLGASWVALGAAAENMAIAAAAMNLGVAITPFPDPTDRDLACTIRFDRDLPRGASAELLPLLAERATNRRAGVAGPLREGDRRALMDAAASEPRARLLLAETDAEIAEAGALMGAGDRISFLSPLLHPQIMAEFRWTAREANASRDGFDLRTLELEPSDLAAMRILSQWPPMDFLGKMGEGRGLEAPTRKAVASSSAVGLLAVEGNGPEAYFLGGRVMQRVWLAATARRLALHPVTGLVYLFAHIAQGRDGFSAAERDRVSALLPRWRALFPLPPGHCEPMLFRLSYAGPPSARSLRRDPREVIDVVST